MVKPNTTIQKSRLQYRGAEPDAKRAERNAEGIRESRAETRRNKQRGGKD